MGRSPVQRVRFRDQSLTSWRAMEKGAEPTQTGGKPVRQIHLCNQTSWDLWKWVEAKTMKGSEWRMSKGGKLARAICICTWTLGLQWEVDLVERMMPMRKNAVEKPMVCEQLVTSVIASDCSL